MNEIIIHKPIWNNGNRYVGIAEYRVTDEIVKIIIDYKNIKGELLYPEPFYITKTELFTKPVQVVKGTRLRICRIADLNTTRIFYLDEFAPQEDMEKPARKKTIQKFMQLKDVLFKGENKPVDLKAKVREAKQNPKKYWKNTIDNL